MTAGGRLLKLSSSDIDGARWVWGEENLVYVDGPDWSCGVGFDACLFFFFFLRPGWVGWDGVIVAFDISMCIVDPD